MEFPLSLARIARMVDFRVVVIDDRPEFANPERFPEADETIAGEMASVMGSLSAGPDSYIVIVTRGHQHDARVLEWAAATDAAYVGMIGSRRKIATIYAHLKEKGITQEQLLSFGVFNFDFKPGRLCRGWCQLWLQRQWFQGWRLNWFHYCFVFTHKF